MTVTKTVNDDPNEPGVQLWWRFNGRDTHFTYLPNDVVKLVTLNA